MKKGQKPNLYCIKGGVGKHLQFTPLLKPLFEKHQQKLLINSAYPEIFKSCPEVADSQYSFVEVFKGGNYFNKYDNLFFHDPYESNFLKESSHIVKEWANLFEVTVEDFRPDYTINPAVEKTLLPNISKLNNFILLQFTGGQGVQTDAYDFDNMGRNYKYGQDLISLLQEAFPSFFFIVFGHDNEKPEYVGETCFNDKGGAPLFKTREHFMILAKYCKYFICIDSALQHICSNRSFNNSKGIVLWGRTQPERFGYKENINMQSEYPNCVEIEPKKIVDELIKI